MKMSALTTSVQHCTRDLNQCRKKRRQKAPRLGRSETIFKHRHMIKTPMQYTKELLELFVEFNRVHYPKKLTAISMY